MGWARFDDRRVDHPKLLAAGLEARGLDEAAICWVAGHETDGFIPEAVVRGICAGHGSKRWQRLAERLVTVGRWIPTDEYGTPGYYIHDYLDYNMSKAEWVELKQTRREAGRKGGLAKALASATPSAKANAVAKPKQMSSRPDPTPRSGGRGGVKDLRVAAQPPSFAAADADLPPRDPDAGSRLREVQAEMAERWGKK